MAHYLLTLFVCFLSLFEPFGQTFTASFSSQSELPGSSIPLDEETPQEWVQQAERIPDDFQGKFVRMLFILALLIGFMILASWALKRMMRHRALEMNVSSRIKVLETRALSTRSHLYLVDLDGKTFLIGESAAGLFHLTLSQDKTG